MPIASANPFPSMLYVEGTTPASPSSGQQRLFVRSSDHVLCMVNSSGTVTPLSGSLTNPMTTAGDVIVGGAAGAPARLAGGALGTVLTGQGAGVAPAYVGGSTLITSNVLGTTAANFDLTSISGAYNHLRVVVYARCDNAVDDQITYLTLNNDGTSTYDRAFTDGGGALNQVFTAAGPGTASFVGYTPGSSRTSGVASLIELMIPVYAGTTFHKQVWHNGGYESPTNGWARITSGFVHWASTAAITRITITPNAGNFIAGSAIYLYGIL